jgi:hypothetical protein
MAAYFASAIMNRFMMGSKPLPARWLKVENGHIW